MCSNSVVCYRINYSKFTNEQLVMIKNGVKANLPKKWVNLYAKPHYSMEQMREMLDGFMIGLNFNQVKSYANPEFSNLQMREMRMNLFWV